MILKSVHTKPRNNSSRLNYESECPDQYKIGIVITLLNRACKINSNWYLFNIDVERLKQLFINNNYTLNLVENIIRRFINKKMGQTKPTKKKDYNILYYENQMNK